MNLKLCSFLLFFAMLYLLPNTTMSAAAQTTIVTYAPFDIKDGIINVELYVDPSIPIEKVNAAIGTITSENSFVRNGQLYFDGWQGALNYAAKESGKVAPILKITFAGDENAMTIVLTSSKNAEYSGLTTFTEQNRMIERSKVTIFDVCDMSSAGVAAVTRHELGHALGLGHALAFGDLMYPVFDIENGYISNDDITALEKEYWQ